jgi:hypothetical protein
MVDGVDCVLKARKRFAAELAGLDFLVALNERAPIVDELVP